jgi:site-specific DNA-methyltransferase (adenine-specific)
VTVDTATGEITESPTPYQLLPRLTDEEYAGLKGSIRQQGVLEPIVVDEDGTVIDGHHRAWIAADLGVDCPRRVVSGLSVEQKRAHAIAANVYRRQMSREQRREMVGRLRELGMSTRRIAEVAGVHHSTVADDLVELPVGNPTPSSPIVGSDGKTYSPPADIDARRRLVQAALDNGQSQRQIAEALGVAASTISNDIVALRKEPDEWGKSPRNTPRKVELIRELTAKGYRAAQIGAEIGISEQQVRSLAKRNSVELTADKAVGKTRRIDSNVVVSQIVADLEQLALPMRLVKFNELDAAQAEHWANSLTESIRALNRFTKQIKELVP